MLFDPDCLWYLLTLDTMRPLSRSICSVGFLLSAAVLLLATSRASAQSIIRRPGRHPRYSVEAEPHLLLAIADPFGVDIPGDWGYGLGARMSIPVAHDGLIAKINDSVAVGFGVDYVRYTGGPYGGPCVRWAPGPAGTNICVQTEGSDGRAETLIFPVVFQWNFWLSEAFSVFGEPGLALVHESVGGLDLAPFVLWGGGRYRFSDTVTLTGRIGFPSLSLGVSFLL